MWFDEAVFYQFFPLGFCGCNENNNFNWNNWNGAENPDADIAMIAQLIASFENPIGEKAAINIKNEFNSL